MGKSINNITRVKVAERTYDLEQEQPGRTWATELDEFGIRTYFTEYRRRKELDMDCIPVNRGDIQEFFMELYDFVRSADMCEKTIDDCKHTVTFWYGPYHKETFEEETWNGSESLTGKINSFVDRQRAKRKDEEKPETGIPRVVLQKIAEGNGVLKR